MAHRVVLSLAALLASVAFAGHAPAGKEEIDKAVQRGVARLKQMQAADGSWPTNPAGATALVGLTLLECNVPPADPAIQRAATFLRAHWMDIQDSYMTYGIALTVLFFDRLGDPADTVIIQALAARLLAGQNDAGGWSYGCPAFSAEERRQLKKLLNQGVELKVKRLPTGSATRAGKDNPGWPKEIQHLFSRLQHRGVVVPVRRDPGMGAGDNSNTQFAILGLWAARRRGAPVEGALAKTMTRFRTTQHSDGGWSYLPVKIGRGNHSFSTPSMTCAGLLGVALGFGSAFEATLRTEAKGKPGKAAAMPDLSKDPLVRAGLFYVTNVVDGPLPELGSPGSIADMYYVLWSIERVAVAYNLPTFGEKDWYAWGSKLLLIAQGQDGGWKGGKFGTDIDTSFALLFLRRVNLTKDLTAFMRGADALNIALKTRELPSEKPEAASKNDTPGGDAGQAGRADAKSKLGGSSEVKAPPPPSTSSSDPVAAEARRLGAELLKASGQAQENLLEQLKEGKGSGYTEALATAIPQLKGAVKTKARDALSERLARMTASTLREKMQDSTAEIRRSAALASAMKAEKQLVPDLIGLLEDDEPAVARAAHAALKHLSGKDLGPSADASPEERTEAVTAWKAWWKKQ
jgi:hypothetical protein